MEHVLFHQRGMDSLYKIWHTPGAYMLILMHSDGGSIVSSERTYPIQRGVMCFIGAEKYHYTMPETPNAYDRSKLFLTTGQFQRLMALMPEKSLLRFTPDAIVYARLESEVLTEAERLFADVDTHRSEAVLMSCWLRLLIHLEENTLENVSPAPGFLSKAIEYINQHLCDALTIDSICAAVHMSKYHFCRQFKKAVGMTVMEYVLQTRLAMAKTMLHKKDEPISSISSCCGFSSLSYFSRAFHKAVGMSPLQYRKNA